MGAPTVALVSRDHTPFCKATPHSARPHPILQAMQDYCSTCCYVEQEALKKQAAVQEEGLTNEGKHHMLLLHKQVQNKRVIDKRGIEELVHEYITGAGLTGCEIGAFSWEKYHNSQGHAHSPFLQYM